MNLTIVRLTDTLEFVGIFSHDSLAQLRSLVAEIHTPEECSYACLEADNGLCVLACNDLMRFRNADSGAYQIFLEGLEAAQAKMTHMSNPDLDWRPLDPEADHDWELLDELLASREGRSELARLVSAQTSITTA